MKKYIIEFKWAMIFVAVSLLWMLLERLAGLHSTNVDKHSTYTNLFAILAIVIYIFALLDKRKNSYNGVMSWKQGLVSGMIISTIIAIISPLTQIISVYVISPDFFKNVSEYAVSSGQMTKEVAEGYFNIKSYIFQGISGALLMGLITTVIVAFFVKTNSEKLSVNNF